MQRNKWRIRACLLGLMDVLLLFMAYGISLLARFDFQLSHIDAKYLVGFEYLIPVYVVMTLAMFWYFRLYHSIWEFASVSELYRLVKAWFVLQLLVLVVYWASNLSMPRTFLFLGTFLAFVLTTALRFSYRALRILLIMRENVGNNTERVMVIGAGAAGKIIIHEYMTSVKLQTEVCCVIDDNPGKVGRYIDGVPIIGGRSSILQAVEEYDITKIVVALPGATAHQRKAIINICSDADCKVQTVPGIYQLIDGEVSVSKLRNVQIEDLLGRDQIDVSMEEIRGVLWDKVILVTGGGGSIGSELCRQIAACHPRRLIIFDIYENNAYSIQQELLRHYGDKISLVTLIGSVRDERRLESVFAQYKPDMVFHAAAHKHVPLMEESPDEAIKNNVFGTYNAARLADQYGTSRFVLISTDKAVNPTNIMGASKRLCEMVIQMMARKSRKTEFVATRFGNVLGSNGSVIPLFKKQIKEGGPVTITDKSIIRYFMTIPEAVSLVLQAACYAHGGEIFILDMGEPVRIDDMARKLIRLSGYVPDVDIPVVYTGLRPGEKLFEEMLMDEEGLQETPNHLIKIGQPIIFDDDGFLTTLRKLDEACHHEAANIKEIVASVVETYKPDLRERT